MTVPLAARSGLAFSSIMSAVSRIISSKSSMPCLVWAETGMQGVSPPHSSGTSSYSVSCSFTRSGLAPSLSILLIATMMDTPALGVVDGLHGLGHDAVVRGHHQHGNVRHLAPRARIAVKASWPGVSRKVMSRPSTCTR
mgnify:CR=1 FL=1